MRLGSVFGEAGRNLSSGTTRAGLFALIVALVGLSLGVVESSSLRALERQAEQFHTAGGATYVLNATGAISGSVCDSLSLIDGIEASGALRTVDYRLTVATAPGSPVPVAETTPQFVKLLDVQTRGYHGATGLLFSSDVADAVLPSNATSVETPHAGSVAVVGTYEWPRDGRLQALSYSALSPVAAQGTFDECWITVWPPNPDTADLISISLLPGAAASGTSVSQLNASLGRDFDGPGLFDSRGTRWAPWLGAAIGLILGYASIWLRRLALASARQAGVRASALLAQVLVETCAWTAAAFLLASAPLALLLARETDSVTEFFLVVGRAPLAGSLAAVCGAAVAVLPITEKRLVRYFRDR